MKVGAKSIKGKCYTGSSLILNAGGMIIVCMIVGGWSYLGHEDTWVAILSQTLEV